MESQWSECGIFYIYNIWTSRPTTFITTMDGIIVLPGTSIAIGWYI